MEDEFLVYPNLQDLHSKLSSSSTNNNQPSPPSHLFAVFDGHAGGRCSKFLKSQLVDFLTSDSDFQSNIVLCLQQSFHKTVFIFFFLFSILSFYFHHTVFISSIHEREKQMIYCSYIYDILIY